MHKHHLIINWELHGVSKKIHYWNSLRTNQCVTYGSVWTSWTTAGSKWSYLVLDNLDRFVEHPLIVGAKSSTIIMVFRLNFHRNRTQFLEILRFCEQSCPKLFSLLFFPLEIFTEPNANLNANAVYQRRDFKLVEKYHFYRETFGHNQIYFGLLLFLFFRNSCFQTSCKCHIR